MRVKNAMRLGDNMHFQFCSDSLTFKRFISLHHINKHAELRCYIFIEIYIKYNVILKEPTSLVSTIPSLPCFTWYMAMTV